MLDDFFSKDRWFTNRKVYMVAARECRDTLTNPEGHWHYASNDGRLKQAVGSWVIKAREAHKIALGRRPMIVKAVVIDGAGLATGSMYAA